MKSPGGSASAIGKTSDEVAPIGTDGPIEPDIAAIARKRQLAAQKNEAGKVIREQLSHSRDNWGEQQPKHQRTTAYQASTQVGLKPTTYASHKKVLAQVKEEAPELMPFVERGDR